MSKQKHEIAVFPRSEFGKNAARRARRDGMVPVNVYAKGKENRSFYVKSNEWEALSKQDFSLAFLVNGSEKIGVIVKEEQINYMKSYVVHVDFQEVDLNEEIHASVKVVSAGASAGENHGGVVEQIMHEIELVGKAQDMPEMVEVDVTDLDLGQSIMVKDVKLPAGVSSKNDPEAVIFHVVHADEEIEVAAPAEGGESAEPQVLTERKRDEE